LGIINAVMVPHPPIIIPGVGRGEERKIQATTDAYFEAAGLVAGARPDTIVITTPHGTVYADWFHISPGAGVRGSFAAFGEDTPIAVSYDEEFVRELAGLARSAGFPAGTEGERSPALDHGALVPLYFLGNAYGGAKLPPVVRISISGLSFAEHYRLGMLIKETAEALGRRVSVVASGDLSHYLTRSGPYGYRREGPQYDRQIMEIMGEGSFGSLLEMSESFCRAAGECGHRSFSILAGCFDGVSVKPRRLSYEGSFGVGYGICTFEPGGPAPGRQYLDAMRPDRPTADKEDPYVRLARLTVETYVKTRKKPALPTDLPDEMTQRRAGVFVTLHIWGRLRGCIGTTEPTTKSIAREIIQNGISSCSRDPRFPPVRADELPLLEYSVDVLGAPEDISSPEELDVERYGVIVSCGHRRGLLLPDLEGVDTVEEQISIAMKKAGIVPGERDKVSLQRFEVERHV
jgi:AmmeMemoRadiSam system protein A/AmmeMemoRadiSam system protein B